MPLSDLTIDIAVLAGDWAGLRLDLDALVERAVTAAIAHAALPTAIAGRALELSVVLTDDKAIRILNADYRGKDKPTNVLSFATLDDDDNILPPAGPVPVGDVIVALETLQREAAETGKTAADHLTHLLVHGTLHLLGYDHIDEEEANTMESLEIFILGQFGIENPYSQTNFME